MLNIVDNLKIEELYRGLDKEFFSCDEIIVFKDSKQRSLLASRAKSEPLYYSVTEYVDYYSIQLTKKGVHRYIKKLAEESSFEDSDVVFEDYGLEEFNRILMRNAYHKLYHIK